MIGERVSSASAIPGLYRNGPELVDSRRKANKINLLLTSDKLNLEERRNLLAQIGPLSLKDGRIPCQMLMTIFTI